MKKKITAVIFVLLVVSVICNIFLSVSYLKQEWNVNHSSISSIADTMFYVDVLLDSIIEREQINQRTLDYLSGTFRGFDLIIHLNASLYQTDIFEKIAVACDEFNNNTMYDTDTYTDVRTINNNEKQWFVSLSNILVSLWENVSYGDNWLLKYRTRIFNENLRQLEESFNELQKCLI